jgi:cytochrome b
MNTPGVVENLPLGNAFPDTRKTRIWDPLVRIFHWSLALLFAVSWLWKGEAAIHEGTGKAILALVILRIGWGIAGPNSARFAKFIKGPAKTFSYLSDILQGHPTRTLGHNPAGAAMIVALLLSLLTLTISGILMSSTALWGGVWMDWLHSVSAYATLGLIGAHIVGVVLASLQHKENLPLSMVTGDKDADSTTLPYEGVRALTGKRFSTVALWTLASFGSWLLLDTAVNASFWRLKKYVPYSAAQLGCEIELASGPTVQIYPTMAVNFQAKKKGNASQFEVSVPMSQAIKKRPTWPTDKASICP